MARLAQRMGLEVVLGRHDHGIAGVDLDGFGVAVRHVGDGLAVAVARGAGDLAAVGGARGAGEDAAGLALDLQVHGDAAVVQVALGQDDAAVFGEGHGGAGGVDR